MMSKELFTEWLEELLDDIDDTRVEYSDKLFNPYADVYIMRIKPELTDRSANAATMSMPRDADGNMPPIPEGMSGLSAVTLSQTALLSPVMIEMQSGNNNLADIGKEDEFGYSLSAETLHIALLSMGEYAANEGLDSTDLHSSGIGRPMTPCGLVTSRFPWEHTQQTDGEVDATEYIRGRYHIQLPD